MNSAQILTHPAFNRAPVQNARRHGPTPRGIPMLSRVRWEKRSVVRELYDWASSRGLGENRSIDEIRCLKLEYEAIERIKESADLGTWLEIQRIADVTFRTVRELRAAQERLIERHSNEII